MERGGILALDVATTTGWAYGWPNTQPEWGTFEAGRRGAANGEILARFYDWLEERILLWWPSLVAFESPYLPRVAPKTVRVRGAIVCALPARGTPLNANVARRLYQLVGLVMLLCFRHNIPVREETPSTITQNFTGFAGWGGRDEKKKATVRMCEFCGWQVEDDNQADALALLVFMETTLFPQSQRAAGPLFAPALGNP